MKAEFTTTIAELRDIINERKKELIKDSHVPNHAVNHVAISIQIINHTKLSDGWNIDNSSNYQIAEDTESKQEASS